MGETEPGNFWSQLKERKVIRAAMAYIIVGWVMMQVGEVSFESLGLPDWSLRLLIILILLGFPIVLVMAWVYDLTPSGLQRDKAAKEAVDDPDIDQGPPSIAVLPFEDMSELGDQRYFCDGLAEEILNALCDIANLRVASRMAAFQFEGRHANIGEVGRKLGVQTVLEGSVRKSGDNLRITVQLVKTSDGFHLWSRQFDRKMSEIFEIQREIADATASAFSLSLRRRDDAVQIEVDPKAYEFFLRGLGYFGKHTSQDNRYARRMFRQAITIEPDFGRAWAGLAYTHGFEYLYYSAAEVNMKEARHASDRALQLVPNLAEAHVAAGMERCMRKQFAEAEEAFRNAIEIDPHNYEAWYLFARNKVHEGDLAKALELFQRASRVRPDDYQSVLLQAQLYISLGQHDRAIEVTHAGIERVRSVLELNPDDIRALNMGAFALVRLGEREEAMEWMRASSSSAPNDSIIQYNAACFYSLAGEVDKALDCLENCLVKVGSINREWLENDSDMDNIRDHPRFSEILDNFYE
jgi:TolB-like protein/Tfp pilus assembly protein PilF